MRSTRSATPSSSTLIPTPSPFGRRPGTGTGAGTGHAAAGATPAVGAGSGIVASRRTALEQREGATTPTLSNYRTNNNSTTTATTPSKDGHRPSLSTTVSSTSLRTIRPSNRPALPSTLPSSHPKPRGPANRNAVVNDGTRRSISVNVTRSSSFNSTQPQHQQDVPKPTLFIQVTSSTSSLPNSISTGAKTPTTCSSSGTNTTSAGCPHPRGATLSRTPSLNGSGAGLCEIVAAGVVEVDCKKRREVGEVLKGFSNAAGARSGSWSGRGKSERGSSVDYGAGSLPTPIDSPTTSTPRPTTQHLGLYPSQMELDSTSTPRRPGHTSTTHFLAPRSLSSSSMTSLPEVRHHSTSPMDLTIISSTPQSSSASHSLTSSSLNSCFFLPLPLAVDQRPPYQSLQPQKLLSEAVPIATNRRKRRPTRETPPAEEEPHTYVSFGTTFDIHPPDSPPPEREAVEVVARKRSGWWLRG